MSVAVAARTRLGFAATLATLLLGIVAFWPTVRSLAQHWQDTENLTYTHGWLIAGISAWLLWRARARLDACELRPWRPAIVLTLALSLAWYVAWVAAVQIGHQFLWPLVLIAALAGGLGLAIAREAAFPVAYLYFAIPVWSEINVALQSLTTLGVTVLIRVTGLPAYIEGNFVHLPSGSFEIAGGCSGLHFLIVALAVAALYGELDREDLRTRLKLLALAAVMAVVMNWIRVYAIILNGHLTEMEGYLVKVDHYTFGWVLFAVLLALYFWIARRFLPARAPEPPVRAPAFGTGVAARAGLAAALVSMAAGPVLAAVASRHAFAAVTGHGSTGATPMEIAMPPAAQGWAGPEWTSTSWRPVFKGADAEGRAEYRVDDDWIVAYAATYESQAQGRELVGGGNSVLGKGEWHVVERAIRAAQGDSPAFREVEAVAPDGTRWVVGYVYRVGGSTFTGDAPAKLWYGLAALGSTPQSGVAVAAARCAEDCENARVTLAAFFAANGARLIETLGEGRART